MDFEGEDSEPSIADTTTEVPDDIGGDENTTEGKVRVVCGIIAVAALGLVIGTAGVLAVRYRGGGLGVGDTSNGAPWSRPMVRLHTGTSVVAIPFVAIWAVLTARAVWPGATSRIKATVLIGGGSAVILAILTPLTWPLVAFDAVALRSVTSGAGHDGLWRAAFDDDVVFVFFGSQEVSQSELAGWLVVHLAAPVFALVSMGLVAVLASRSRHGTHSDDAMREVQPAP